MDCQEEHQYIREKVYLHSNQQRFALVIVRCRKPRMHQELIRRRL